MQVDLSPVAILCNRYFWKPRERKEYEIGLELPEVLFSFFKDLNVRLGIRMADPRVIRGPCGRTI